MLLLSKFLGGITFFLIPNVPKVFVNSILKVTNPEIIVTYCSCMIIPLYDSLICISA